MSLRLLFFFFVGLVLAGTAIALAQAAVRWLTAQCRRALAAFRRRRPRKTLRCVPRTPPANWWQKAQLHGNPAMQLVSDWHITSTSDRPVRIQGVRLLRPHEARTRVKESSVMVLHPEGYLLGDSLVPPGESVTAVAEFWVQPPICPDGQRFAAAVAFVDSLGNQHLIDDVPFVPWAEPSLQNTMAAQPRRGVMEPQAADMPAEDGGSSNGTRRYGRARVKFEAEVWSRRGNFAVQRTGRCAVLGVGGAFVEVRDGWPVGSRLSLRLRFPDFSDVICQGIVRNGRDREGVGVEFVDLSPKDRDRISSFVDDEASSS